MYMLVHAVRTSTSGCCARACCGAYPVTLLYVNIGPRTVPGRACTSWNYISKRLNNTIQRLHNTRGAAFVEQPHSPNSRIRPTAAFAQQQHLSDRRLQPGRSKASITYIATASARACLNQGTCTFSQHEENDSTTSLVLQQVALLHRPPRTDPLPDSPHT